MALTRSEMAAEVLDNIGRLGSAVTQSGVTMDTMAIRWLNRAQMVIARKYDMLFKISTATTVASTQTYSFPSNIRSLFSMRLESGLDSRKLLCVMPRDFDRYVPKPDEISTAKSVYYIPYKSSNQFELFPIPDGAYTLRMRHSIWPTDMATGGSYSTFQSCNIDLDDVLISFATAYAWKYLQEDVDAKVWLADANKDLYDVYASERDSFPDWSAVGRGFSANGLVTIGEYYNDPFITKDP